MDFPEYIISLSGHLILKTKNNIAFILIKSLTVYVNHALLGFYFSQFEISSYFRFNNA